jgi:uncharacterized membrane protein YphA (DoxX/SURF4 family)
MKWLQVLIRVIVGSLFIFSGLIKANDPLGLSYKIQEFFEIWKLQGLDAYTLYFSLFLNTAEIVLGVSFLIGWNPSFTRKSLLAILVFFTFLTGYTYYTGLPKNCGCFGDCLPLTAFTSFVKDVLLTFLVLVSLRIKHKSDEESAWKYSGFYSFFAGFLALLFQFYVLTHLPLVDCLPYKVGANLVEGRKVPANAIPDSTVIYFTYEKNGKEIRFPASHFPADFSTATYRFINREDQVVRQGKNTVPLVKDFYLTGITGIDSTDYILQLPSAVLVIAQKATDLQSNWISLDRIALQEYYPATKVFIITAQYEETRALLSKSRFAGWPVFKCDLKAIQTAARTSPTIFLIKEGKVIRKKAAADF